MFNESQTYLKLFLQKYPKIIENISKIIKFLNLGLVVLFSRIEGDPKSECWVQNFWTQLLQFKAQFEILLNFEINFCPFCAIVFKWSYLPCFNLDLCIVLSFGFLPSQALKSYVTCQKKAPKKWPKIKWNIKCADFFFKLNLYLNMETWPQNFFPHSFLFSYSITFTSIISCPWLSHFFLTHLCIFSPSTSLVN